MVSLKGKIRSQIEVMQAELAKEQTLRVQRSLARKLERAETDWREIESYYTRSLTLISEQEAEDGRAAHEQFQTQFFTLMGWVQDAIDKAREEEEAQEQANLKVSKVCLLGERWGAAYHRIETVLGELMTQFEGELINSVELLDVKSARLEEIKAQISSATA